MSYHVGNPKDRFSRIVAQITSPLFQTESEFSSEEEEEADCYKQLLSNLGGAGGTDSFKCRSFVKWKKKNTTTCL